MMESEKDLFRPPRPDMVGRWWLYWLVDLVGCCWGLDVNVGSFG
jgi:hypothetical protein